MSHRSEFLTIGGVRTHLQHGGGGAPVLVLHPEYCGNMWHPYLDGLAAHGRVLAPDHLGFGNSERPDWLDAMDDLVLHYADLLTALDLPRAAVVGTSFGGWIAAAFAATYPERVSALILIGAAGLKVDGVARYDLFLNSFEDTLPHLFHDPVRATQLLPAEYGPELIVRGYHDATTLARLAWNPYFYDPKLERRLARISAPTLVVWGKQDTFLPLAYGEAYARAIPGAVLRTVADCGHFVPFEQTAAFVRLATDFLAQP
ncbi:MAG: alpha/beta hydrolase [Deltaproteobacteria bacterium]|nr:alpha/beta hydrolase [Deltaproteobacteria bacterium]